MLKELWRKYKEVVSYLFFGVATTVVNWIVYSIMNAVLGASMNTSNVVAWVIAVLFAFVTNKLFVFESKKWKGKEALEELVKFVGARVATGIVEIVGLPVLYQLGMNQSIFGVDGMVAKVVVSVVVIVLNYVFSKFIVFTEKKSKN
ncbi:MAG: GtrA family protein [Lachnospiraceae bacterium]|nr:GtrA family protein [Lachnospiraceae bacterium]